MKLVFAVPYFLFFLLLSLGFCVKAQELRTETYPDGTPRYKGSFLNGKPVGELIRYYPGGKVRATMNHRGDTADVVLYNRGGDYVSSGKYIARKKESQWEYRKDDRLLARENYRDDRLEGMAVRFFTSGKEAEKKGWLVGKPHGEWCLYYDSGNIRMQAFFEMGKLSGVMKSYNRDGVLRTEGHYKDDLKEGKWLYYDNEGHLIKKRVYHAGIAENAEEQELEESRKLDALIESGRKIPDPAAFADDPEMYMKMTGEEFPD